MSKPKQDLRETHPHGTLVLPSVTIDSYSLELQSEGELIGDQASQTAFRALLGEWRERLWDGDQDPFGRKASDALSKKKLDRAANGRDAAAVLTIELVVEEFSQRLANVAHTFLQQSVWRGVERIIVGGGFKQSEVGKQAIRRAHKLLKETGFEGDMVPLRHEADDGGLMGWVHLAPPELLEGRDAILAVDIGGTNVRCGIVELHKDPKKLRVIEREKWRHADDGVVGKDLIEGIVEMLGTQIASAKKAGISLSPFIGIACPGIIRSDGSIARGAQNLPDDWQRASFHLPRRLHENIPSLGGAASVVLMHNDAVVQGLSELPFVEDTQRWAVLTVGTGLGNASFTNRH